MTVDFKTFAAARGKFVVRRSSIRSLFVSLYLAIRSLSEPEVES